MIMLHKEKEEKRIRRKEQEQEIVDGKMTHKSKKERNFKMAPPQLVHWIQNYSQ